MCLLCRPAFAHELSHPDCTDPERWAAAAVGVRLKNLHLSAKAGGFDRVEVERLASEQVSPEAGPRTLFRQVHKVTIYDRGKTFVAITINNASRQECSESEVDVYIVSIACDTGDGTCLRRNPRPGDPASATEGPGPAGQ